MATLFLLFEAPTGYAIFHPTETNEIIYDSLSTQRSYQDRSRFTQFVKLVGFKPFTSSQIAFDNLNAICNNEVTDELKSFLELTLPQGKNVRTTLRLGVYEPQLGAEINKKTNISCVSNNMTTELLRGIRTHFQQIEELSKSDLHMTQLGLAHAFSRAKVKYNVNKVDNMIIQAVTLTDTLDKDVNAFIMRVKEWYGWHFPELANIVSDTYQYARIVVLLQNKSKITNEISHSLVTLTDAESKAGEIIEAARTSIGQEMSTIDMINIKVFAKKVTDLTEFRHKLNIYLQKKMQTIAPNLSALIGEVLGARLISRAGSLLNLAKYPASYIQMLGAEKALFSALKTKSRTPKYGLIFHSSFIGKANQRNKGRISRYLANKCSIAARIDAFMEGFTTNAFGKRLREQVEERSRFYDEGLVPKKNIIAMQEVLHSMTTVP
jgi:nucleolar protein 56